MKKLYIGQATFVPLRALSAWICDSDAFSDPDVEGMDRIRRERETAPVGLESVRLVDCYVESHSIVPGNKVSYSFDSGIGLEEEDYTEVEARRRRRDRMVEKVRRVVTCEAVTERIMGGDRVEAEGRMMLE